MENTLQYFAIHQNRTHEARENMDQEVNRKYEGNALNMYELNSINSKQIDWHLHMQDIPYLMHNFWAKISRLDSSSPHVIFLQYVHSFGLTFILYYHVLEHPQHAKIMVT